MPPKKKVDALPSTMKELKDTLWKAADKLRGSMDASQYKDVILGLVFLKYVSDAFEERQAQIRAELEATGSYDEDQIAQLVNDIDEYTGHGVFGVPPTARWNYLSTNAQGLQADTGERAKTTGEPGAAAGGPSRGRRTIDGSAGGWAVGSAAAGLSSSHANGGWPLVPVPGLRVTPWAWGSTSNSTTPSAVDAGTRSRAATSASGTLVLSPVTVPSR